MINKILFNLIVITLLSILIYGIAYDNVFTLRNISDSLFVSGMIMFFYGLITVTNALNVFDSFKYLIKRLYKNNINQSYYEYSLQNQAYKSNNSTMVSLVIGLITIIISFIIGYMS